MERNIYVYGHPAEIDPDLDTDEKFREFILRGVFLRQDGEYRSSQGKNADVIVLSRGNMAFGHFEVGVKRPATEDDKRAFNRARFVYFVESSACYAQKVPLKPLGVQANSFGEKISEHDFRKILENAGILQNSCESTLSEGFLGATYPEGAVKKVLVNAYERDSTARAQCIARQGTQCKVCEIDLGERYGDIGRIIHVHHLRLLSQVGENYRVDPDKDLRPVCPNCHAMLHKKVPPFEIDELKAILKRSRNKGD